MSCIAVSDNYFAISKGLHIDCYDNSNHTYFNVPPKSRAEENDCITDIVISSDSKYLATITSSSKQLTICNLPFSNNSRTFILPRSASKIRFTVNNSQILVADKSGDVLLYDINAEESGAKLLSHLSLLLDVLQTNDEKYVISSDRDEKICVTCFPNTYNIKTYCLGHKEFVNHIELLPHDEKYLTSTSGDGTVKCWDYESGELTYNINTSLDVDDSGIKENFKLVMDEEGVEVKTLPIVHYTATALTEDSSLLAVAIHSYNKLLVYTLETKNKQFIHKKEDKLIMEKFPTGIKLHRNLFFHYDDLETTVTVWKIVKNNNKIIFELDRKIKMFDAQPVVFASKSSIESIKVLYKRKFDNVQEYQQRKKQRLERNPQ